MLEWGAIAFSTLYVSGVIMLLPQLASMGPGLGRDLTLRTTPEVIAMFSASSTVLVATVLTLETTASLTALACSLVFSATVGGIWQALALIPPNLALACPNQVRAALSLGTQNSGSTEDLGCPLSDSREALMMIKWSTLGLPPDSGGLDPSTTRGERGPPAWAFGSQVQKSLDVPPSMSPGPGSPHLKSHSAQHPLWS